MPSKPVIQNECERCTRKWYTEKAVESKFELKADLMVPDEKGEYTRVTVAGNFTCLCAGCTKTVAALAKSIAKEFKPRQPRAKKVEPADKGNPSSTDPASSTPGAAPVAPAAGAGSASAAVSSSGGGGQRPSPPAPASPHPKK